MTGTKGRAGRVVSGSLWMLSGLGGREAVLLALNVLLARILVPADFAAVALVMAVVAILNIVSELGVSVALVRRGEIGPEIIDSAFTLTVGLFGAGAMGLFMFAVPVAAFYGLPVLKSLVRVAAITFFVQGFSSFFRSLLLREMKFQAISLTELCSTVSYGSVAIAGAVAGWGAHSIMWGYLAGAVARLGVFLILKGFPPRGLGSLKAMGEILGFGVWVSIGRVMGQAAGKFDRLLLGKIVSPDALGGYYIAQRFTTMLPNLITGMVDQVLLPIYADADNDAPIVERGYWKGLRFSAILVLPICAMMASYARPLVWLALGEKWLYAVPLVRILSIFGALQSLGGGVFASAIYASGKPRLNAVVNGFRIVVLPVCVWVGSRWGIQGVAWGVALYGLGGRLFNQLLLRRYLGYSFSRFFGTVAIPVAANVLPLGVGVVLAGLIKLETIPVVLGLTAGGGLLCLLLYGVICRFTMPTDSAFLFEQLKSILHARFLRKDAKLSK